MLLPCAVRLAVRLVLRCGFCAALLAPRAGGAETTAAAHAPMRIRIEWGGGEPQQWQGRISLTQGALSDASPLGVEADEPGSMWCRDGVLHVAQRSLRVYDGVDVTVTAPADAHLVVDLSAQAGQTTPAAPIEVSLATLAAQNHNSLLGQNGNRLSVRRAPGDALRVKLSQDSTLFLPGDLLQLEVEPRLPDSTAGSKLRVSARLLSASSSRQLWSDAVELGVAAQGEPVPAIPLEIKLPETEGVYDLVIEASRRLPSRLGLRSAIVGRKVQLIVVSGDASARAADDGSALEVLEEIEPANPAWWSRLKNIALIPGMHRGPLGNDSAQPQLTTALGPLVRLGPGGGEPNIGWEAYPLPIHRPGEPHILEIEFPTDVAQTLGISIVEPNKAGEVLPIGLDSGVYLADDAVETSPRLARHRVVFWPRTEAPLVLLTNRRDGSRAAYGKIRLIGPRQSSLPTLRWETDKPAHLPRAPAAEEAVPQRLLAAYYDRPLFPENFSAAQALDELPGGGGRCFDDWSTFYQGATRLVEYLNHVGYNGLMITALADGSTIYPSKILEPTPKYDDGVFFASGQDPMRKDVLELLFRLFDREKLKLIAAVQFSAPLPELEALLRDDRHENQGIELVGVDGSTWLEQNQPRQGRAPYYNPLDARVQQAMLAVVRELADRYHQHPSFAGLALQLSADGYAQLPGAEWGYDQATIRRFQKETNIDLAGENARTPAMQVQLLTGKYRSDWLAWRTEVMAEFHQQLAEAASAGKPDARLYLAGVHLFDSPPLKQALQPALPRSVTTDELLKSVGIDPARYKDSTQIVLLRPQRIAPLDRLSAQAANLELNQAADLDRAIAQQSLPGSQFFHEPLQARLASFDEKNPFGRSYVRLVTQASPVGHLNRKRFVHALATLDTQAIFDGGWLLSLGQEEALAELVRAYRRLPAERFATLGGPTQPVTIRTLQRDGRTFVYLVNDSPWPVSATLSVGAPPDCRLDALAPGARVGTLQKDGNRRTWSVALEPYDLVGGVFNDEGIQLADPQIAVGQEVTAALRSRIQQLWTRATALHQPAPFDVLTNPGFEQPSQHDNPLPGWQTSNHVQPAAQLHKHQPHTGSHSVRLALEQGTAWLKSQPFASSSTGRLSFSVWLRVADEAKQPPLRLALEGQYAAQPYYRYAAVGLGPGIPPVRSTWSRYVFQIPDLPPEGLTQLQVRFDLMGPGEVWIDDVRLTDLEFTDTERLELSKTITLAEYKLQHGELGDCERLLQGYWPRFLEANVPAIPGPVARKLPASQSSAPPPAAPPQTKPNMMERFRNVLPGFLR